MSNTRRIESLWVGGRERLTWHSRASSEAAETGGDWRAAHTGTCALAPPGEGQGTDCLGLDNGFFLQQRLLLRGAQFSSQTIQVFQVGDLLGVLSTLGNGQQMASRAGYFLDEADGTWVTAKLWVRREKVHQAQCPGGWKFPPLTWFLWSAPALQFRVLQKQKAKQYIDGQSIQTDG